MGMVLKLRVRDEVVEFDVDAQPTAGDIWALDEMGLTLQDLGKMFEQGERFANITTADAAGIELGLRAMCTIAFLGHRRAGNNTSWLDYARTLRPHVDLEVIEVVDVDAPVPANRQDRRAAAKRNGKASKVGEALAAADE